MGIGPCILTKVVCAFFMGDARWVIGWAMVGRAEFAQLGLCTIGSQQRAKKVNFLVKEDQFWMRRLLPF